MQISMVIYESKVLIVFEQLVFVLIKYWEQIHPV